MNAERPFFAEIQGLRAVAVLLVLVFHLWPAVLPGGFVGVDVFFVISGYLITGVLLRGLADGGWLSLIDFYARRARRLLPAAMLVLFATLVGTLVILPASRWENTAIEIGASALYVQNWLLAVWAVDYLGADIPASPVQHYWSLSVEEQFYLAWPFLMMGAYALARRFGLNARRTLLVVLGLTFAASLAASLIVTAADPDWAFLVTHTRIWELALGGLLVLTVHHVQRPDRTSLRTAMAVAGLVAIGCAALTYSAVTPYPGSAALLPVLGAAAVILAGDVRLGPFTGLNVRWLRYVGDRSYSIYLWHWPLITFYAVGKGPVGLPDGIALLALTLAISHLSFRHVEERFRHPRAAPDWRAFAWGTAAIAGCVLAASAIVHSGLRLSDPARMIGSPLHPGPAALLAGAPVPAGVEPVPALRRLRRDVPVIYRMGCHQDFERAEPVHCALGDPGGAKTLVIAGDSHAAQWVPALERIARAQGWRLLSFTKSACPLSRVEVHHKGKPYASCLAWRENVIREVLSLRPDIVFTSQSRYAKIEAGAMVAGLHSVWSSLAGAGIEVVVINDTPGIPFQPGDCLAGKLPEACVVPLQSAKAPDTLASAARSAAGVRLVDLTDGICGPVDCRTIVGNMIVWRDGHHLTAVYAAALAPYLSERAGLPVLHVRDGRPVTVR